MKKVILILSLAVAMTLSLKVSAQEAEEFKPSGKLSGLLFADFHNTFSAGENLAVFEVTRSYFGYGYGKFTLRGGLIRAEQISVFMGMIGLNLEARF